MASGNGLYRHDQPLRNIVSGEIRSRIFTGAYPPGTRLVERDLADEFKVSRFPVREAIRILRQEGLVEDLPTRGIVVKRLSRKEVEEVFDIRESLESLAARLAAERVAAGESPPLDVYVDRSHRALLAGDLESASAANSAFHDELIKFSGNETLQDVLTPLMGRLHWLYAQVSDFDQVYREHDSLSAAIARGEPKLAALEAQRHVLSYRQRTLEHLYG